MQSQLNENMGVNSQTGPKSIIPTMINACKIGSATFVACAFFLCDGRAEAADAAGETNATLLTLSRELLKRVETLEQKQVSPGTIVAFAGSTNSLPPGWLICNGDVKDRVQFPALFEALGTIYGKGNRDGEFKLPDLRGMFLRGWSAGSDRDRDRGFGSVQGQSTAQPQNPLTVTIAGGDHSHPHRHALARNQEKGGESLSDKPNQRMVVAGTRGDSSKYVLVATPEEANVGRTGPVTDAEANGSHKHAVTVGGGDPETRPTNVAVLYIIKI